MRGESRSRPGDGRHAVWTAQYMVIGSGWMGIGVLSTVLFVAMLNAEDDDVVLTLASVAAVLCWAGITVWLVAEPAMRRQRVTIDLLKDQTGLADVWATSIGAPDRQLITRFGAVPPEIAAWFSGARTAYFAIAGDELRVWAHGHGGLELVAAFVPEQINRLWQTNGGPSLTFMEFVGNPPSDRYLALGASTGRVVSRVADRERAFIALSAWAADATSAGRKEWRTQY